MGDEGVSSERERWGAGEAEGDSAATTAGPASPLVFNCQLGRGRTTTAMVRRNGAPKRCTAVHTSWPCHACWPDDPQMTCCDPPARHLPVVKAYPLPQYHSSPGTNHIAVEIACTMSRRRSSALDFPDHSPDLPPPQAELRGPLGLQVAALLIRRALMPTYAADDGLKPPGTPDGADVSAAPGGFHRWQSHRFPFRPVAIDRAMLQPSWPVTQCRDNYPAGTRTWGVCGRQGVGCSAARRPQTQSGCGLLHRW